MTKFDLNVICALTSLKEMYPSGRILHTIEAAICQWSMNRIIRGGLLSSTGSGADFVCRSVLVSVFRPLSSDSLVLKVGGLISKPVR